MIIAEKVQHVIHALEVGRLSRWMQFLPLAAAVVALAVLYDLCAYRSFSAPEAMDAAQVARNLADGKGFTTDYIRPFSVFLISKHNHELHAGEIQLTNSVDFAQVNSPHPDLANPPVYPMLLAGLFKWWQPDWKAETHKPFWAGGGRFLRYKPEFRIAITNQVFLLLVVALTFFITRELLDVHAAWLAALLTLGAENLWHFSVSGLPTLLLLVFFLAIIWLLVRIEALGRAEPIATRKIFFLAILAGAITGLGMLTRYSFGWVMVPLVIHVTLYGGVRRPGLAVAASLAFAAVVSPWLLRNYAISGTLFGTAGYAVVEGTFGFPGSRLMQSLNPDLTSAYWVRPYLSKLLVNIRYVLQGDVLQIGGGWLAVLFLAGLLLGLRNLAARRLRYFTMSSLGVFIVVQALGRTTLSNYSPDINSENILVLLTPLIVIFGVLFFLTLLDQMKTPSLAARYGVIALLVLICCEPLIAALLPPRASTVSYPPYYPPEIQKVSAWMRPEEMMMSDIPWGVAWYGRRQCVWTTMNSQYEFFQFNDYVKPVRGLYLTLITLDGKLFTECLQGGVDSWGNFVLKTVAANQIPPQFPLQVAPYGLQSGLFLTDRQRWDSQ